MKNNGRLEMVYREVDRVNAEDPCPESFEGNEVPAALLYGLRMSRRLEAFFPEAGEALRIAARAQHIGRWRIARSDFEMNREGYLRWRTKLYSFHAGLAADIMQRCGFREDEIQVVRRLLEKKDLKSNPDMQVLEDVICMVFLEYYFEDFIRKHETEKLLNVIRKTWRKMSRRAQSEALKLSLSPKASRLVEKALELPQKDKKGLAKDAR